MTVGTHRVFFAIVPDPAALVAIERAAVELKASNIVRGRWVAPSKCHLTIAFLGNFAGVPADVVERARDAAADLNCTPFAFDLDRAACFRGRYQAPCVLRCTPASEALLGDLHQRLWDNLRARGFADTERRRYIPHVTIAYADRSIEQAVAIAPVRIHAEAVVLYSSHPSQQEYEPLGRWPLQAAIAN